jgi:hypothetical protein
VIESYTPTAPTLQVSQPSVNRELTYLAASTREPSETYPRNSTRRVPEMYGRNETQS